MAVLIALTVGAAGCRSVETGGLIEPDETARLQAAFEVPGGGSSSVVSSRMISRDVVVDQNFTIDSVDISIRELQAGRQGTACRFGSVGGSGDGGDDRDCEEFNITTLVESLPVQQGSEPLRTIAVAPGTFDRMAFRLNRLEGGAGEEMDILRDRSELRDASVFLTGTFDGTDFELTLGPDQEVTVGADTPLTLEEDGEGTITVVWRVASWFERPDGTFISPVAAADDQAKKDSITANLLESVEVTTANTLQ